MGAKDNLRNQYGAGEAEDDVHNLPVVDAGHRPYIHRTVADAAVRFIGVCLLQSRRQRVVKWTGDRQTMFVRPNKTRG